MLKDPPLPGCIAILAETMNYPAAELRGIKMNLKLIYPDAEHRGILLIKYRYMEKLPTINFPKFISRMIWIHEVYRMINSVVKLKAQ